MTSFLQDMRFGLRQLGRCPGFAVLAILTLAVGVGAATAIFSAADAVLLHPLPFSQPERLMLVTKDMPSFELVDSSASPLDFLDYRAHSHAFSAVAGLANTAFNLAGDPQAERVSGKRVSASIFPMLGVRPLLGRALLPEEEQWGRHFVVVLGEELWRRRFGANPAIVGKQVRLDGESYTVVGVVPPFLQFLDVADLWVPLAFAPKEVAPDARGHQFVEVVARLRPGVSLSRARAEMRAVAARMTGALPDWYPAGWTIRLAPLESVVAGSLRPLLLVLAAAVAALLLIACVNVANLLLVRAAARQREMTLRAALGAGRLRVVRQLLTESLALAAVGGAAGLLLAALALAAWGRSAAAGLLRGQHPAIDARVALFAVGLALATSLLFGLAPAWSAARADLRSGLQQSARGASAGWRGVRLRSLLVACEVGLALVLLIAAGLLIRSLQRLQDVDPGFRADHVLTCRISLPAAEYRQPEQVIGFYRRLLERLRILPGVVAAGAVHQLPLTGGNSGGSFGIIGRPWPPGQPVPDIDKRYVTPGYFAALGIPLRRGRELAFSDTAEAPRVALVDEQFARRFFPGEEPLGRRITGFHGRGEYALVGVVGGIRHRDLAGQPQPTIYYSALQDPYPHLNLVVRSAGDPFALGVGGALRREVQTLDRGLAITRLQSFAEVRARSLLRRRVSLLLLAAFAGLALALAAVGIFGVIAATVAQRRFEIGVRMALGDRPGGVVALVLRQGMQPVVAGLALGLAGALAATRLLAGLLFQVGASDPATYGGVALLLAGVAAAACYLPARRAARVDPAVVLRAE
ncbi:MAG TPA: ABC transporter permease [Thermoanaerobaculia bacterium]|nr:ABC transporter permease [Thermoanaerobaculia bacterium]